MLRRQKYLAEEKLASRFANTFLAANLHRAAGSTREWKLSDSVAQLWRLTATENIIRDLVIQLEVRKLELIANLFILLKG